MTSLTEKLEDVMQDLNLLLKDKIISSNDLEITPDGTVNALNINIGFVNYYQSGPVKLYYQKTGLQQLMAKVYNPSLHN